MVDCTCPNQYRVCNLFPVDPMCLCRAFPLGPICFRQHCGWTTYVIAMLGCKCLNRRKSMQPVFYLTLVVLPHAVMLFIPCFLSIVPCFLYICARYAACLSCFLSCTASVISFFLAAVNMESLHSCSLSECDPNPRCPSDQFVSGSC